jgi:MerR family transcriptional regulator, repressor of the yfmOP operon
MGTPESKSTSARPRSLRIGDVARLVDTTPRTIRYYEEIGLLPTLPGRHHGGHRLYSEDEVDRLREVMRLRNLLGVSLDELKTLLAAEDARAAVRVQLRREDVDAARRRELLAEALGHLDRQLELVNHRSTELQTLKGELSETRKRVKRKIRELDAHAGGAFPPEGLPDASERSPDADTASAPGSTETPASTETAATSVEEPRK